MGLFSKLHRKPSKGQTDNLEAGPSSSRMEDKTDKKKSSENDYDSQGFAPPPGPPPSYQNPTSKTSKDQEYMPPPGPPPSHRVENYQPPPGPPKAPAYEEYLPPPGPPPSHSAESYQPPPGPPPGRSDEEPPSYHDWQTAVPDTSLLPPPPAAANDTSPTSNADSSQADRARDWCRANPLRPAGRPNSQQLVASRSGAVKLISPGTRSATKVVELGVGAWSGTTTDRATDLCFTTSLPLYFVHGETSPKMSGKPITAYFEVHLNRLGKPDHEGNLPSLAVGFVAAPYPTWRMPGWERGSLAVHSDDGRRFVNNQDGGVDFVEPFKVGDVVGLGVKYWSTGWGGGSSNTLKGEAFFTRNGRVEDTWDLQEETDVEDQLGNLGVEGDYDLFGAIGTYGEVGFKAVFVPEAWAFNPAGSERPGH